MGRRGKQPRDTEERLKSIFFFFSFVALLCGATLSLAQVDADNLGAPIAQGEMRETEGLRGNSQLTQGGTMEEPERAAPSLRQTPPLAPKWETREGLEVAAKAYFQTIPAPQKERVVRVERTIRYLPRGGASKAQVAKLRAELALLRKELGRRFSYMESMLRGKLDAMERKARAESETTRKVVKEEAEGLKREMNNQGILIVLGVLLPILFIAIIASAVWALTRTNNEGA